MGATNPNLQSAGTEIGAEIGEYLSSNNTGAAKLQIGVFRFGDASGIVSAEMGIAPTQLQGHIMESLTRHVKTNNLAHRFAVLDIDELDITTGGSVAVKYSDPAFTRIKLSNKGIGIGVIGTLQRRPDGDFDCKVKVITPNSVSNVFERIVSKAGVDPFTPSWDSKISGRFSIKVMAKPIGSSNFEELTLRRAADQSGEFRNVIYMFVDRARFAGQPYQIHLRNNESKSFVLPNALRRPGPNDADRTFGVSLYVDGVSAIFQQQIGSTDFRKDIRHPAYVSKFLLTPSTRKLTEKENADSARFKGFEYENASPPGHSHWKVKGFQKDQTAASFVFGTAAHSVGAGSSQNVNQIGLISAFFYAEELESDVSLEPADILPPSQVRAREIGTIAGPDVQSQVSRGIIKNFYQFPAEVWHLKYLYDDDSTNPDPGPPIQQ
ncbi:hypothetical protein CEE69_25585 [Rhodopirellula bahusiensis]|uniref:Uncharacterized protein n=1 Tax=Rhodopirellula bahusiensis TaxID=2014065 RepID=A0A2G1W0F4_9BACT|nr:hypothetical protein CEE69_25585 [Rhodopirellula bahusiensis]